MFFFACLQALLQERDRSLNLLEQLKDYDEKLAKELAAKARQEQEMQKLEVYYYCFFFLTLLLALKNLNRRQE